MRILFCAGLFALAACQTVGVRPDTRQVIAPALAVMAAADAAPAGFPGTFGFEVMRAEFAGPRLFLNSYPDYRDQRNLSVAIEGRAVPMFRRIYGDHLTSTFMSRRIEVTGLARRQRIDFTVNGRPSGKYYFQTHVRVTDPAQIRIVG